MLGRFTPFGSASLRAGGCSVPRAAQPPAGTGAVERRAPGAAGCPAAAPAGTKEQTRRCRPVCVPPESPAQPHARHRGHRHRPRHAAAVLAAGPPAGERQGTRAHQTYFLLPNELRQKDLSVVKAAFGRSTDPSRGAFAAAAPGGRDEPAPANLTRLHKKAPGLLPLSPPCCCGNTAKRCENALNEQTPRKYSGFKSHLESCPGFQTTSGLLSSHGKPPLAASHRHRGSRAPRAGHAGRPPAPRLLEAKGTSAEPSATHAPLGNTLQKSGIAFLYNSTSEPKHLPGAAPPIKCN